MLINEHSLFGRDLILDMIAQVNGNSSQTRKICAGIYQIGHFSGDALLRRSDFEWNKYPENLSIGCYGVCDSHEQVIASCPELSDPDRKFVVTLTEVRRSAQESQGGWRWHKWGAYIGNHEIKHEYLYDEQGIDRVFVYHIYERI